MSNGRGLYSIGVVARITGLHEQTIRQYEKLGFIKPERTAGGTRVFSDDDLKQLKTVANLTRDMGVNLAGVEIIMKMRKRERQLVKLAREMFKSLDDVARQRFESLLRGDEPGLVPKGEHHIMAVKDSPRRKIEIEDNE